MSFGAGHIQDMINRLKQNRALKPSNRSKFKENNREEIYSKDKKPEVYLYKEIPENELNEIKKKIQERAKAERKNEKILYVISIVCFLIILVAVFRWLN